MDLLGSRDTDGELRNRIGCIFNAYTLLELKIMKNTEKNKDKKK